MENINPPDSESSRLSARIKAAEEAVEKAENDYNNAPPDMPAEIKDLLKGRIESRKADLRRIQEPMEEVAA